MKKLFCTAAFALVVMASCQKDLMSPIDEGSNQKTELTILANLDALETDTEVASSDVNQDPATKAVANAVIRLNWAVGDKVSAINLTTGKALGGDLVAQESGSSSLFSGTLIGAVNRGDQIAFLYPSQGYTKEQTFTGATVDLSKQSGTSSVPLAVYGVVRMNSDVTQNMSIEFKYLMSYYQINLIDLPFQETIESVRFPDMGAITSLTINGNKDGFVSTAQDAAITVKSSGIKTNDKGVKAVYISGFASPSKYSRTVEIKTRDFSYSANWSGASLNVGRYYAAVVTGFKGYVEGIEDPNFKAYCLANFDTDHNGEISKNEALAVTSMSFNSDIIESLKGIDCFRNLQQLNIYGSAAKWSSDGELVNSGYYTNETRSVYDSLPILKGCSASGRIRFLDLTGLSRLKSLSIKRNILEELILDDCAELGELQLDYTCLSSLDVTKNQFLTLLSCTRSHLTSLELNNARLTDIQCSKNQLSYLDVSKCRSLSSMLCDDNMLTSLDLSQNTSLSSLNCSNNQLTSLNLSQNTSLSSLNCSNNQITELDVSKTALGFSSLEHPLMCSPMPSLRILILMIGWQINGINVERSEQYIPSGTRILYDETEWRDLGVAQFYDDWFFGYVWEKHLLQASDGSKTFRIVRPFTKADIEWEGFDFTSEMPYLEFTIDEDGSVHYGNWFNLGFNFSGMSCAYASPLYLQSNEEAEAKNCVLEEGFIQFCWYPILNYKGSGGFSWWGSTAYAYLSMPGGPDLNERF